MEEAMKNEVEANGRPAEKPWLSSNGKVICWGAFNLILFVLSLKMFLPRSGLVLTLFVPVFLFLGFFALFIYGIVVKSRARQIGLFALLAVLTVACVGLRVVYESRKNDVINALPVGETVAMRLDIKAEFSSGLVSGFVYNPSLSLKVNGKSYKDEDLISLEIGKDYAATLFVSDRGHNQRTTQRVSGSKDFTLRVGEGHMTQDVTIGGIVQTDATLTFERKPSFWEVVFSGGH